MAEDWQNSMEAFLNWFLPEVYTLYSKEITEYVTELRKKQSPRQELARKMWESYLNNSQS